MILNHGLKLVIKILFVQVSNKIIFVQVSNINTIMGLFYSYFLLIHLAIWFINILTVHKVIEENVYIKKVRLGEIGILVPLQTSEPPSQQTNSHMCTFAHRTACVLCCIRYWPPKSSLASGAKMFTGDIPSVSVALHSLFL